MFATVVVRRTDLQPSFRARRVHLTPLSATLASRDRVEDHRHRWEEQVTTVAGY